ncbi:hypothetical protein [Paenibacillus glycinis]|uniref:Apea-like HEPN domain-containing protein n=1 Tax=Paenibacillus glycinis TaxID=2697035 RepID=A0ABW9XSJ2_9BACL|nr:hypothetical protein [Paenibacillus glycinis]NBD25640.1 hypothetical protein [Paenibacillus glycinis]
MTTNSTNNATKTVYDFLYEKLLSFLEYLTEGRYEQYLRVYEPEKKEDLEQIIVVLFERKQDVQDFYERNELYNNFFEIQRLVEQLDNEFPEYLENIKYYYKVFLKVCQKICEIDPVDFSNISLQHDAFKIVLVDVNLKKFSYIDQRIEKSILLISTTDIADLEASFLGVKVELLFYLILKMDMTVALTGNKKLCLVGSSVPNDTLHLKSFIELFEVSSGGKIHTSYNYNAKPSITSDVNWNLSDGYYQLNDSIYILSEYNSQDNILDKYLKLYQVIENFMYRQPICQLVNGTGSDMFTIRQFKSLYKKVAEKEQDVLETLLKNVFEMMYQNALSLKFKDFIHVIWNNCKTASRIPEIDEVLSKLGCSYRCNSTESTNRNRFYVFYSDLIYKMRNSIVHNKETEYHVTYGNFNNYPANQYILEEFLLKTMEEVVFNLMINKNNYVWYNSPNLKLYSEVQM